MGQLAKSYIIKNRRKILWEGEVVPERDRQSLAKRDELPRINSRQGFEKKKTQHSKLELDFIHNGNASEKGKKIRPK